MNNWKVTSIIEWNLVFKWLTKSKSLQKITSLFDRNHGCIPKIIKKYHKTGKVVNALERGCKQFLNDAAQRKIIYSVKKDLMYSALKLIASVNSVIQRNVSAENVHRTSTN